MLGCKPFSDNSRPLQVFEVVWDGDSFPNPLSGCDMDDSCSLVGDTCHCTTTTSMDAVFTDTTTVPSPEELVSQLHIGAPQPDMFDAGTYTLSSTEASGVEVWIKVGSTGLDMDTIFKVPAFGGEKFLANKASQVTVGGFSFRNPPSHSNPYLPTSAEAAYEIDALVDHLVDQPNTPLFISHRMILRFTSSNPSPRYVTTVADAFRTGSYDGVVYSGEYGDIGAMMAAILLDREARSDTLEMDPAHGKLREPLLKVVGLLRSMELESHGANPVMTQNLQSKIGQDMFQTPSVFNFYDPDYSPPGTISDNLLYSPEAQLLTPPYTIEFLNFMLSTIDQGMGQCNNGLAELTTPLYSANGLNMYKHHVPSSSGCSYQYGQTAATYEGPGATSVSRADGFLTFYPSDSAAGLDEMDLVLTGGRLSSANKAYIQEQYDSLSTVLDGPSHMTAFGAGLNHAESACELDSTPHELSCCADTQEAGFGNKCSSWTTANNVAPVYGISNLPGYGCVHDSTHDEAVELCAAIGGRLCTEAEILGGCVYATGCGHSWDHLHTSTECPDPVPNAVKVAQKLIIGAPEYHLSGKNILLDDVRPEVPPIPNLGREFKAIVLVYLAGGHDSWSMLVPHSNCPLKDMYAEYESVRTSAAIALNNLLEIEVPVDTQPCSTFGVHYKLPNYKQLYDDGDMLFVANIGTLLEPTTAQTIADGSAALPYDLFSHLTQSRQAQNVHAQQTGAKGVLGRMVEALTMGDSPFATRSFSITGNHLAVQGSMPAVQVHQGVGIPQLSNFAANSPGYFYMSATESAGLFAETFAAQLQNTLETTDAMGALLGNGGPAEQALITSFGATSICKQMKQVAKVITQRDHPVFDNERNLFVVQLGGFDTHQVLEEDLSALHQEMNAGIGQLSDEMKAQGLWEQVTIVTASEFGRTLTSNGLGTDHAWGGHNAIAGGAVDGGKILGTYPNDLEQGPTSRNIGRGRMVPSTPWEAIWYGLSQWMDVPDENIEVVIPNVNNWQVGHTLFTKGQIFSGFELGFDPNTDWSIAPSPDLVPPVLWEVKLLTDNTFGIAEDLVVDCTQRDYQGSVAYCESVGGSIASIHSQEENDAVWSQLQTMYCNSYIGAESDGAGNWAWHDGSAWDYVNPENDLIMGIDETRIAFLSNGQWHDYGTGWAQLGVVCSIASYESGYAPAAGVDVAATGGTVTLILHASEQIETPTVIFQSAGMNTEDSGTCTDTCTDTLCDAGVIWACSYTVAESDYDGDVTFSVEFVDTNSNQGITSSTTTDDSSVSADRTEPAVATATLTSTSEDTSSTTAGDVVDLIVEFTEPVIHFDVSLQSGGIAVTDAPDCSADDSFTVWTCVYTVGEADGAGDVSVSFTFADTAGNTGVAAPIPEQPVTIVNVNPVDPEPAPEPLPEPAPEPAPPEPPVDCVGEWVPDGECSVTCGGGTSTVYYLITQQALNGGLACPHYDGYSQLQSCGYGPCPVDCDGFWSPFSECSATCGGGLRSREFTVVATAVNGGAECEASDGAVQEEGCAITACPIDCEGSWGSFGDCSMECGGGYALQEYTVTVEAQFGGAECPALNGAFNSQECNTLECPPIGTVSTALQLSGDVNNLPPTFEADFASDMAALLTVDVSQLVVNSIGPPIAPIGRRLQACEDNNALVSSFQPFLSNSGGLDCATIIGSDYPSGDWTCDYDTAGTVCNGPPATGPLGSCPDIAGPLSTYCPLTCGAC